MVARERELQARVGAAARWLRHDSTMADRDGGRGQEGDFSKEHGRGPRPVCKGQSGQGAQGVIHTGGGRRRAASGGWESPPHPVDRQRGLAVPSGCLKHLAFKVERLILIFF